MRGWRDIAQPPQIAALPTDHRGFPVPYVAEWENVSRGLKPEPGAKRVVVGCTCVIGVGKPDLGAVCPVRQRRCMIKRRCQVCSRGINARSLIALIGAADQATYTEPPLHLDCAAYSLRVCPGIARKWPSFAVHVTYDYTLFERYVVGVSGEDGTVLAHREVPIGDPPPFLPEMRGKPPLFDFYAARPVRGQRYGLDEWLASQP